jgi:hypothetical protein
MAGSGPRPDMQQFLALLGRGAMLVPVHLCIASPLFEEGMLYGMPTS